MESSTGDACPICGKHSNQMFKCGGCNQQVYCSKDHQKRDWSRHRSVCRAWEIHENPELGRHLLASRDLNKGDLILSESPLVWGPALHTDQRVCVSCGKQCSHSSMKCHICFWPMCKMSCPIGPNDKNRHDSECMLLVNVSPRFVTKCLITSY